MYHAIREELLRGKVLVPVEPTQEMYDAADRPQEIRLIWQAMIAAAQTEGEEK